MRVLAALPLMVFLASPALSQGANYDVKTMNFDLWCQNTQHLPADRCDKRLPEDEKVFEAFRAQVEHYEVPYLQRQRGELSLDRNILHNDPVSHPLTQDPQAQAQSPTEPVKNPSP